MPEQEGFSCGLEVACVPDLNAALKAAHQYVASMGSTPSRDHAWTIACEIGQRGIAVRVWRAGKSLHSSLRH